MPTNVNLQKIIINSIPTKEIYNQMKARGLLEPNQLYLVEEDSSVADMTKAVYDANGVVQNAGGIVEYVAANGGKIDVIKLNGTLVPIVDKAVDIDIPTELSELTDDATHRVVTDTEKAAWNAKGSYSKPSGGIPKTDLASGVQQSLSKADSALQSFTETDPVFKASPAYGISSNDIENWDNKQSPILDLGTIRNNAAAGAAKVSCTDDTVGSFGYTKNTGDMEETVYDPDGLVAAAGGIPEYVEQNTPDPDSILDQNTRTPTKVWRGTKAQYDALASYQNDTIYHVIGDEDASVETVQSFNGRTGDVVPRSGDYTADQVGAIPSSEKGSPNGVPSLDARGKIPLAQIPTEGYVPTTRKINGNALTDDIDITAESIDAVPKTRKINGDTLDQDILITPESLDVYTTDQVDDLLDGKLDMDGGTLNGPLTVPSLSSTGDANVSGELKEKNQRVYSPNNKPSLQALGIHFSTSEPTSSDGQDGDLWIVYEP